MLPHNRKCIQVIEWWMANHSLTQKEMLIKLGLSAGNYPKYKKGKAGFTPEQIRKLCKLTGVSADYIFGFKANMFREGYSDPLDKIAEALAELRQG